MPIIGLMLLILSTAILVAAAILANRARAHWATLVAIALALWMATQILAALPAAG
jgi:hypothetical protein